MADAPFAPPALESQRPVPRPGLGYTLVWSAVILWSLNAVIAKVVLDSAGLSSMRLAEVRATGAAVILMAGVALVRPATLRTTRRELGFLVVFGVLGLAFVQLFYFVGIQRLDIGIALVIQYLAPVFVALWARFYVHEPVRRRLWLAIALCLLGLSLVVELWGGSSLDGLGVVACLVTAVAYAAYVLMAEHSLESGRDVYSLLAWGFTFAALFWAVFQPWWSFPVELVDGSASLLGRFEDVSRSGLAPARLHRRAGDGRPVHHARQRPPSRPGNASHDRRHARARARGDRRVDLARGGARRRPDRRRHHRAGRRRGRPVCARRS